MAVKRAALKGSVRMSGRRCCCRLGVAASARGFHRAVRVRTDLAERECCSVLLSDVSCAAGPNASLK